MLRLLLVYGAEERLRLRLWKVEVSAIAPLELAIDKRWLTVQSQRTARCSFLLRSQIYGSTQRTQSDVGGCSQAAPDK